MLAIRNLLAVFLEKSSNQNYIVSGKESMMEKQIDKIEPSDYEHLIKMTYFLELKYLIARLVYSEEG